MSTQYTYNVCFAFCLALMLTLVPRFEAQAQNTHSAQIIRAQQQSFTAADAPSLNFGNGSLTVEAWVKVNAGAADTQDMVILEKRDAGDTAYMLYLANGGNLYAEVGNGTSAQAAQTIQIDDGTWHHVAFTYDQNTLRLYLDGVERATQPVAGRDLSSSSPLFIGRSALSNSLHFDGLIDEVRLWSVVKTEAQIHADASVRPSSNDPNLKAAWYLDNSLSDSSINGNSLTAVNAPTFSSSLLPDRIGVSAGLLSWYRFDNDTANDSSGNANHGALNGTPQFVPGVTGKGVKLNGTTDWINIGPDGYQNTMTVAVWVRIDAYPPATGSDDARSMFIINNWRQGENFYLAAIRESNGDFPFEAAFHKSSETTVWPEQHLKSASRAMPAVNPPLFYHLAQTYDGTTLRFYVNGRLEASQATVNAPYTVPNSNLPFDVRIGWNHNNAGFLNGVVDEVRLYNRSLSPGDVQELYELEAGSVVYATDFEGTEDLLAHWNSAAIETTPGGTKPVTRYIGNFGTQPLRLTLPNIPAGSAATVNFDLYVMGDWGGNYDNAGAGVVTDRWAVMVRGSANQLFTTSFSNKAADAQAFPMAILSGYAPDFPARQNALEQNSLGYSVPAGGDSVYRIAFTTVDGDLPFGFEFAGENIEPADRWGIDNIVVRSTAGVPVATISGNVTGTGLPAGIIRVSAKTGTISYGTNVPTPGPYTVTNVPLAESYSVLGYVDENANSEREPWEWVGFFASNPLLLSGNATAINLNIQPPVDADADGMADEWEAANGLVIGLNDAWLDKDGDDLQNLMEYRLLTNVSAPDSDGDLLNDGQEYSILGSMVKNGDSDGDLLPDAWETANGLNLYISADAAFDFDGDGLTNAEEFTAGLNPRQRDSNTDGTSDYAQVKGTKFNRYYYDRTNRLTGAVYDNGTWMGWKYDGNSNIGRQVVFTGFDADNDGLPDVWELQNGLSFASGTGNNGPGADNDNDGWSNQQEFLASTNPNSLISTPTVPTGGASYQSAPLVRLILPPASGGAHAKLKARVWDNEANPAALKLEYFHTASSEWRTATLLKLDNLPVTPTTKATSTAAGTTHDLLWDALTDLGPTHNAITYLRIQGTDFNTGAMSETTPFSLNTTGDFDGDGTPDTWEIAHNHDPNDSTGSQGATADTDNDGLNAFGEYVFHLSPTVSDASNAAMTGEAINPADGKRYLTLTYRKRINAAGLTYQVQTTSDLAAWTTNGTDIEPIGSVPTGDGITELVTVRIKPPLEDAGTKKFVRVRVVSP